MTAELVRQLHGLGVIVDVGVFDNNGRGDRRILEVAAPYLRESVVFPCRGQFDRSTIKALRRYVAERHIDVVHSHKYKTTFYGLLARRGSGARLISTYHNWLGDTLALKFYAALDKRLARYCDAAVGVSHPVVDELRRYAPPGRVYYVGNGVDMDSYRRTAVAHLAKRALGLPEQSTVVGFVGRLSAQKGVSYLLQAMASLPDAMRSNTHFVVVGDGEHRAVLERQALDANLTERVHFLGTRNDTPALYSAFDIFVLPSECEAFPMVVLEAMACGVPVIGTDVGDVARIVEHGVSGLVVPPRDTDALRTALCQLIVEPSTARHMGDVAHERVVREHSALRMGQRYLAVYNAVLSR